MINFLDFFQGKLLEFKGLFVYFECILYILFIQIVESNQYQIISKTEECLVISAHSKNFQLISIKSVSR